MESSVDPIIQHTDEAWVNSLMQLSQIPISLSSVTSISNDIKSKLENK